jgi:peroxiredoxin
MDLNGLWANPDAIAAAKLQVPPLTLESTHGPVDLRAFCAERAVLYTYPATGVPGRDPTVDPAPGWDDIPGAAGCTLQSLGFKHHYGSFSNSGLRVAGISTQPLSEQLGFASSNAVPFPLICDELLGLQHAWSLPTFTVGPRTFLKRMLLYVDRNELRTAMYPVENPGGSATAMLLLLANREGSAAGT